MHETERHRIILSAVQEKPVVDGAGTGRTDGRVRGDDPARHRGAACAEASCAGCAAAPRRSIRRSSTASPAGRFSVNETVNVAKKRAIAREAVELCEDGEPIIINGGTTTFQMVHFLAAPPHAGVHQFVLRSPSTCSSIPRTR